LSYNVLIIDNDPDTARILLETFAHRGIRGTVATDKKTALQYLSKNYWHMVFVNPGFEESCNTSTGKGQLLCRIKADRPEMPVIMISCADSARNALDAIRAGFAEFLVKPVTSQRTKDILDIYLPNHKTQTVAAAGDGNKCLYNIIGASPALARTIKLAKKVAPTSAPVLITGQSGTGKELIAQLIHNESQRSRAPFVKVNCASLSESLLESELFGHEKGAFTGAASRRIGRFERAHGGTLLLDEITETKHAFQTQLLRVLEQMDFERVGGTESINVNVRVISTTNKDILDEVEKGRFRADLYYRISAIRLAVPPLSRRKEDLPLLIWHFVNQFAHEAARRITSIDPAMLEVFAKYHWPGNIRQLRNVIRTSIILGSGPTLTLTDTSWLLDELQPKVRTDSPGSAQPNGETLRQLEQRAILKTLRDTGGNQTKAAKVLGISDRTLREKVKKYRSHDRMQLTGPQLISAGEFGDLQNGR
jgi:DNA-binding NtrC family response regulator